MERNATWAGIGTQFRTKSLEDAFKAYDLDYEVGAIPVYGKEPEDSIEPIRVPGRLLTYRKDNAQPFGIVSDKYPIIQNREALGFIESIIGDSGMELVNGGHTSWGSYFMIGELPEVQILGDSVKPHLIFQSSHDGTVPLKATICMLRMVCQNQFAHSFKESPATIRVLHKGNTEAKMKTAAATLIGVREYVETYGQKAEQFAGKIISPKDFNKIVEGYFKIPEDAAPRTEQRIVEQRELFQHAYDQLDNGNLRGNLWGVINAYTDYATHREVKNKESLFLDSINPHGEVHRFVQYVENVA